MRTKRFGRRIRACIRIKIRRYLSDEQYRLYKLIWERFVASQMVPAVFDQTTVEIDAKNKQTYDFRVSGSVLKFDGFLKIYEEEDDDEDAGDSRGREAGAGNARATVEGLAAQERAAKLAQARRKYDSEVAKIQARNDEADEGEKTEEIPAVRRAADGSVVAAIGGARRCRSSPSRRRATTKRPW